jgi:hypothetical protein
MPALFHALTANEKPRIEKAACKVAFFATITSV